MASIEYTLFISTEIPSAKIESVRTKNVSTDILLNEVISLTILQPYNAVNCFRELQPKPPYKKRDFIDLNVFYCSFRQFM